VAEAFTGGCGAAADKGDDGLVGQMRLDESGGILFV
jgi:hypothetical protein